ncbi:MAG: hypothetical protein HY055_16055 [Magnetospirillum sp.]|nr:hypothetical protein [Magnetospirillum sp.]
MAEALAQAASHHQAEQLPEALRLYRAILEVAPRHRDTNHNIRRCRQDLMTAERTGGPSNFLRWSDFFSAGECRDLLLHVQEHCMTLGGIPDFLDDSALHFMGFEIDRRTLESYKRRFPDDQSATNLRQRQVFGPNTRTSSSVCIGFRSRKWTRPGGRP